MFILRKQFLKIKKNIKNLIKIFKIIISGNSLKTNRFESQLTSFTYLKILKIKKFIIFF